jgi:hypothetical protein
MELVWKRRRIEARTEPLPDADPTPPDTLAQLIRDVDAASAKALKAISSITLPDPKGTRNR